MVNTAEMLMNKDLIIQFIHEIWNSVIFAYGYLWLITYVLAFLAAIVLIYRLKCRKLTA